MILCCINLKLAPLATESCNCLDVDWAESFHQDLSFSDTFVDDIIYGHLSKNHQSTTEAVELIW